MINIKDSRNPLITPAISDIPVVTAQFKVSISKLSERLQELLDHPNLKDDPEFFREHEKIDY
jgi:hypothetical protein